MNSLKAIWQGEENLVFTFWMMGFIIPNLISVALLISGYYDIDRQENQLLIFCVEGGSYFYMAFIGVGLWRSAKAYKEAAQLEPYFNQYINWGTMAQAYVVLIYMVIIHRLSATIF